MSDKSLLRRFLSGVAVAVFALTTLACGAKAPSTPAPKGSEGSSPVVSQKKPVKDEFTADSLIGDWVAVSAKQTGTLQVTGNLPKVGMGMYLTFSEDGKFVMRSDADDDTVSGVWSFADNQVTVKAKSDTANIDEFVLDVSDNKYLSLKNNDLEMDMLFAKGPDITFEPEYYPENGRPIQDLSAIAGTWKIKAFYSEEVSYAGNIEKYGVPGLVIRLNEDGSGTLSDENGSTENMSVQADASGATIELTGDQTELKLAGDDLMFDSSVLGDPESSVVFFFERQ